MQIPEHLKGAGIRTTSTGKVFWYHPDFPLAGDPVTWGEIPEQVQMAIFQASLITLAKWNENFDICGCRVQLYNHGGMRVEVQDADS